MQKWRKEKIEVNKYPMAPYFGTLDLNLSGHYKTLDK